jgi:hypothetical protein
MIGRIFDGVKRRRFIVPVPPPLWLLASRLAQRHFPGIKAEMGVRMAKDLIFDGSSAVADFGWKPKVFTRPSILRSGAPWAIRRTAPRLPQPDIGAALLQDQPALGDRAIEAGGENKRAIGFASTAGIFEAALGIVRASFELFEPV